MNMIFQGVLLVFESTLQATLALKACVISSGMLWGAFLALVSALFVVNIVFSVISDRIRGGVVGTAEGYIPKAKNSKKG